MTDEELQKLEELEEKATPGPWIIQMEDGLPTGQVRDGSLALVFSVPYEMRDARFLHALRNAAKSLIASARREKELEAALEKGEQLCNEYDQRAQNDGFGDKRSPELYGAGAAASDIRRIIRKALQKGE